MIVEKRVWFRGDTKPARRGVYMQMAGGFSTKRGFQYWDGNLWHAWCETVTAAASHRHTEPVMSMYQADDWCGLVRCEA